MNYQPFSLLKFRLELKELETKKQDATANNTAWFKPIKADFLAKVENEIETKKAKIKELETYLNK